MKNVEKLPEDQVAFYKEMGYGSAIRLDGEIVALGPFLYTTGIVIGMDHHGYKHRFCYHSSDEALIALLAWIGSDDAEPSSFITKK